MTMEGRARVYKFMKLISHRGNLLGRFPEFENSPKYIDLAIETGFEVEIDLKFNLESFF